MKKNLLFNLLCIVPNWISACTTCNQGLQKEIYTTLTIRNLSSILILIFLIVLITTAVSKIATLQYLKKIRSGNAQHLNPAPVLTAAIVLGVGLGGFIDGIVFHQILQWHEMLSNEIASTTLLGKSINMFWDGLFHIICLITVCIGIYLLWKALLQEAYHSSKLMWSGLVSGWAIFNITEGIMDHHLFKIHNVRETIENPEFYNLLFIISSFLLLFLGWLLHKSEMKINNPQ